MSNLKKILALVLALVMSMSLVTVAGAAYEDQDQVDARYAEAVQVLSDMGIFKGYNGGASFGPKQLITREEVATIMYRVLSTDLADANKNLFVDAAKFSDVAATDWSAGYIGYCVNGGIIKGYDNGAYFAPDNNVTGYEVLAMILRAVGYDKNGEFSGDTWRTNIGGLAQQLKVLVNVNPAVSLGQPATRELVAELIFRTLVAVDMVEYTPAFSYQPVLYNTETNTTTLGLFNFGLEKGGRELYDSWGRPGYYWYWNTGKSLFKETPSAAHKVAVCECQLADDIGLGYVESEADIEHYENGLCTTKTVGKNHAVYDEMYGGQGTILEVYPAIGANGMSAKNIVVEIDTYLAKVTKVVEKEVDDLGHIEVDPVNELEVYVGTAGELVAQDGVLAGNKYAKGDYILVNYNEGLGVYVDLGVAKTVVGAQSEDWYFADKHLIEGKSYDDAHHFSLDVAKYDGSKDYTWFLDQFGNVIGNAEIINPKTYGIVKTVQWRNPDDERGYARATIMYMDGTTAVKTLGTINGEDFYYCDYRDLNTSEIKDIKDLMADNDFELGRICTNIAYNNDCSNHLYIIEEADGKVNLTTVKEEVETTDIWYERDPKIDATPNVLVNNDTMFVIRTGTSNFTYKTVTGLDNVKANYDIGAVIDYVLEEDSEYSKYVYLIGKEYKESAGSSATIARDFVMLTNKTYFNTITSQGVTVVELKGIVRGDGSTTPVKISAAALEAAGISYTGKDNELQAWVVANINKLLWVKTTNGVVANVKTDVIDGQYVKTENKVKIYDSDLVFVDTYGYNSDTLYGTFAGKTREFDNKGVLEVVKYNGEIEYYNINSSTTIIVKGGTGRLSDLKKAVEDGAYVYIVGDYAVAYSVFVTTEEVAEELGYPVP